jgi:hypothetical protein
MTTLASRSTLAMTDREPRVFADGADTTGLAPGAELNMAVAFPVPNFAPATRRSHTLNETRRFLHEPCSNRCFRGLQLHKRRLWHAHEV